VQHPKAKTGAGKRSAEARKEKQRAFNARSTETQRTLNHSESQLDSDSQLKTLTPKPPPGAKVKAAKKNPISDEAKLIGEGYRPIRPDGISSGLANIQTWLNEGTTAADMIQAIQNYKPEAETRELKFRKKLGNFFGRKEPEFLDWVNPDKPPVVISEKNKIIMGFDPDKFKDLD